MQGERAFLRVREAAPMLGISLSAAYELANAWLDSGGHTGLPAIRLGRSILIPRSCRRPPRRCWQPARQRRRQGVSASPFSEHAVVVSVELRPLRRRLRPLAWLALEEVALDAVAEEGRLVARTSARRVAELLGVDPSTAAAALRVLRDQGLVGLEREKRTGGPVRPIGICSSPNRWSRRPRARWERARDGGCSIEIAGVETSAMAGTRTCGVPVCGPGRWGTARNGGLRGGVAHLFRLGVLAGGAEAADRILDQCTVGRARHAGPRPAGAGLDGLA